MTTPRRINVAVTGAAGQIGYALLFRIASGQMFGPDVKVGLRLLELPQAVPAAEGVRMELEDCAFGLLEEVVCTADLREAMRDVNWVFLVGAVPRKDGMERSDLLQINGGIFTKTGRAINDYAASDVRTLVIGNPCNTNCYVAQKNAPDVPADRFFAMTMLDQNRARAQIAIKAGVNVDAVQQLAIWGNHSATQYPDFYNATVDGKALTEVITDEQWLKGEFISTVQQRGAAIIKARGLSSAASAANAIIDTARNIHCGSASGDWFSVAMPSTGQYEIDEGLIFSFPCRSGNGELRVVSGLSHNEFSKEKLAATLQELRAERDAVKALGLVD